MEMRNQPCMKRVCNQNQERTKVVAIVRVCDPNKDFRDCERVGARISKSQGSVCVCVCCVSNVYLSLVFTEYATRQIGEQNVNDTIR